MNSFLQNTLYALVIAIVVAIALYTYPIDHSHSHGIFLPASGKTYNTVNPSTVKILNYIPEYGYERIGEINVTIHFSDESQSAIARDAQENLAYAKTLAAKNGANTVVITTAGKTKEAGPLDGVVLYATAYRQVKDSDL